MRVIEGAIFLTLAAGVHMGLFMAAPSDTGGAPGGDAGQSTITLEPASASMAQMVQRWQTAPEVQIDMRAMEAPRVSPVAAPAPAPTLPAPQSAAPDRPALPEATAAPAPRTPPATALVQPEPPQAAPAPEPMPRPPTRAPHRPTPPKPAPPKTAEAPQADATSPTPPSAPQPKARAAGRPTAQAAPSAGGQATRPAADASAAQSAALQAQWGARIQRKVHRNLFYPRGASGAGTARVALTVDRNGRLQGVRLIRSSGTQAFDQAALTAVRRAGRFPRAPKELGDPTYSFTLGLNFQPSAGLRARARSDSGSPRAKRTGTWFLTSSFGSERVCPFWG